MPNFATYDNKGKENRWQENGRWFVRNGDARDETLVRYASPKTAYFERGKVYAANMVVRQKIDRGLMIRE